MSDDEFFCMKGGAISGMVRKTCSGAFRKDHAQPKNQSAMTIRPNLVALQAALP
jgi:hypothetical protein